MAKIGCLGSVVFEVSAKTVRTIRNMILSVSARYSTHQLHGTTAQVEYTGADPARITFDIDLSAYLGVNPRSEIAILEGYVRSGVAVPFVIGNSIYVSYRWVITDCKVKMQYYDRDGDVTSATVSVSLTEYR